VEVVRNSSECSSGSHCGNARKSDSRLTAISQSSAFEITPPLDSREAGYPVLKFILKLTKLALQPSSQRREYPRRSCPASTWRHQEVKECVLRSPKCCMRPLPHGVRGLSWRGPSVSSIPVESAVVAGSQLHSFTGGWTNAGSKAPQQHVVFVPANLQNSGCGIPTQQHHSTPLPSASNRQTQKGHKLQNRIHISRMAQTTATLRLLMLQFRILRARETLSFNSVHRDR
jgi:hypothetical protein